MRSTKILKAETKSATKRLKVVHTIANNLADRRGLFGKEREKFVLNHIERHTKY